MSSNFQHFRQRHFFREGSTWPITDGAVLFEAASWKEFRDPKTSTPLTVKDLKTLGYNKEMTIEAIRAHTEELLSAGLPHLIEWCRNYVDKVMQNADEKYPCLIPEQPMEAVRSAIQQILEFCDDAPKKEEVKPERHTVFSKISNAFWEFIFKQIYK